MPASVREINTPESAVIFLPISSRGSMIASQDWVQDFNLVPMENSQTPSSIWHVFLWDLTP
jgi:hypothetical protein